MRYKIKNAAMAFLCLVFFVCAAVLALGAFGSSSTRARAEEGASVLAEAEYTRLTVALADGQYIYTSDDSADKVKSRLVVTGYTAEGTEEPVAAENYTVTINGSDSWTLTPNQSITVQVTCGTQTASLNTSVVAAEISSITAEFSLTLKDAATGVYEDADGTEIKIFDNWTEEQLKQYVTVTATYNDGTSGVALEADQYTLTGLFAEGEQTITATLVGNPYITSSFSVVFTDYKIVGLQAEYTQGDTVVYSSYTVTVSRLGGTSAFVVYAVYSNGTESEEPLRSTEYNVRGDLYAGAQTQPFTAEIEVYYRSDDTVEPATVSVNVTPDKVTSVSVVDVGLETLAYNAFEDFDPTGLQMSVTWENGPSRTIVLDPSSHFSVKYWTGENGETERGVDTGFRFGDTYVSIGYTEGGATVWDDENKIAIEVEQSPLDKPLFDSTALNYDPNEPQSKTLVNFDPETMFIIDQSEDDDGLVIDNETGRLTTPEAGTYTIYVLLTDENYYWAGGEDGTIQYRIDGGAEQTYEYIKFTWTVNPISFNASISSTSWYYGEYDEADKPVVTATEIGTGERIDVSDLNVYYYYIGTAYDGSWGYQSLEAIRAAYPEESSPVPEGAGNYQVVAVFPASRNYSEVVSNYGTVTIYVTRIGMPEEGVDYFRQQYTAQEQTVKLSENPAYTVTSDRGTEVGKYNFTLTLVSSHNYMWEDGTTDPKPFVWHIVQATETELTVSIEGWTYDTDGPKRPTYSWTFKEYLPEIVPEYVYYYDANNDEIYEQSLLEAPTNASPAGSYKVVATIKETDNYEEATAEAEFVISRKPIPLPTVDYSQGSDTVDGTQGYIYDDGNTVSVRLNDNDASAEWLNSAYTIVSGETGVDVNEYTAVLQLNDNYQWISESGAGGSATGDYSLRWYIVQKTLTAPQGDGTGFIYSGEAQTYTFAFFAAGMQISVDPEEEGDSDGLNYEPTGGTVSAVHAGTYKITVTLTSDNYRWDSDGEHVYDFIIARSAVPTTPQIVYPEGKSGYVYADGASITPTIDPDDRESYYVLGGDISAENVGTYKLRLELKSDYRWNGNVGEDGTDTGDLVLEWGIIAREIVRPSLGEHDSVYNNGATLSAAIKDLDAMEEKSLRIEFTAQDPEDAEGMGREGATLSAVHAGTYIVTVSLNNQADGPINYVWQSEGPERVVFEWVVDKALNAITELSVADWTYGETPNAPEFSASYGKDTAVITYKYKVSRDGSYDSAEEPTAESDAGYYEVTVEIPAAPDWYAAEAKTDEFIIDRLGIQLPEIEIPEGGYVYTGSALEVQLSTDGEALGYFTVEGGTQTDAGTYTVTLKLTQNYKWDTDDGEYDDQLRNYEFANGWTISPRPVSRLKLEHEQTDVYDEDTPGEPQEQRNELIGYKAEYKAAYVFGGDLTPSEKFLSATYARKYNVTVSLYPDGNYVWATEGDASYTLTWTIEKQTVYLPATSDDGRRLEFTGEPQTPAGLLTENPRYKPAESPYYEYTGGTPSQIADEPNVYGSYYYAFVLADPDNYKWGTVKDDQTAEPDERDVIDGKTIYAWFKITKTQYYDHVTVAIEGWTYGETEKAPVITLDTSSETGDPLLTEVRDAIAADTPEHNTIAYYYSGELRNGGSYGEGAYGTETVPTQAGTYRLIVVIEETTNYTSTVITTVKGQEITFTISPKKLTDVAWSNANAEEETAYSFTYGEAANAQLTFGGKLEQDTIVVTYRYFKDEAQVGEDNVCPTDVGVYTVTASISNANYCFADEKMSQTTDYVITPKTLTVAVTDQTVVYGEELGKWTISAEGWAYEEKTAYEADFIAALRKGISHDYRAGSPVLEGGYTATISTPELGEWTKNYTFEYNGGSGKATINVEKRKITVTIDNVGHTYGGEVVALTALEALTGGQNISGNNAFAAGDHAQEVYELYVDGATIVSFSDVADYEIHGRLVDAKGGNYEITFVGEDSSDIYGIYTVSPADITFADYAYEAEYSGTSQNEAIIEGLKENITVLNGQAISFRYKYSEGEEYSDTLQEYRDVTQNGGADGAVTVSVEISATNHKTIEKTFTIEITKAALQAYVKDATVDYGFDVADGKFEILYTGWQGSDGESADTYVNAEGATFDLGGFAVGAAQGTEFTVTVGGLTSRNYALDYTTTQGTLTVVARNIIVTLNAQNQTYQGQKGSYTLGNIYGENYTAVLGEQAGTVTEWNAEASALYGNNDLNAALTVADSAKNAGSYKISFESKNKNYSVTVANAENPLFTIEKKEITVALKSDYTVIYGEAAPGLGWNDVVVTDFSDGTDYAGQLGALDFAFGGYTAGDSNARETFTVKAALAEPEANLNYTVEFKDGLLTVGKREVSVTVTWNNQTENGAKNAYTASVQKASAKAEEEDGVTGIIEKDAALNTADNFEYSYASTDEKGYSEALHAGAYKVSVTLGEALRKNYVLNHAAELTFTITPATVDAVWAHGDEAQTHFVYDGKSHNSEVTAEADALGGDSLTLETFEQSGKDFKAAGDYTFVAEIESGNGYGDYVLSEGTKTLSYKMNQRQVVIRANDAEMYYGETPAIEETLGWKYASDSGIDSEADPLHQFVADDGIAIAIFTYATTATSTSDKGTYSTSINVNASLTNYSVTYLTGEMTVNARPIIVTIENKESEYGYDNLKKLTATDAATEESGLTGGIVNEDENVYSLSVDWKGYGGETTNKPFGTYTISGKALDENYEIVEFVTASYRVKERTLTVTAQPNTVVYGDEVSGTQVVYSGFAPGENEEKHLGGTLSFTYLDGETAYAPGYGVGNAGKTFTITPYGYTSDNYTFIYNTATLTVVAREITVTIGNASSVYGNEKDLYGQVKVTRDGQEENALAAGDSMQEVFGLSAYDAEGTQAEFGAKANVGTYYIVGSDGQLKSGNYIIQFEGSASVTVGGEKEPAGTHTITARDLVLSPSIPSDNSYSGKAKEFSATVVEGGAEGEKPSVSAVYYAGHHDYSELAGLEPMASAPKDVGKYTIVFDAGSNYSTAAFIIPFEIKPASVSVVWSTSGEGNSTFTYLGTEQTVSAHYELLGEDVTEENDGVKGLQISIVSYTPYGGSAITDGESLSGVTFKDAGSYIFKAAFAEGDELSKNYTLQENTVKNTYTMDRAEITVTIDNQTGEYGDERKELTATVTSGTIFEADMGGTPESNPVYTLSAEKVNAKSPVGTYYIAGATNSEGRGFNYDIKFLGKGEASRNVALYTVKPRVLIVTAEYGEGSIVYGEEIDTDLFSLTYERRNTQYGEETFVNGDQASSVTVLPAAFGTSYRAGVTGAGSTVAVTIDTAYITFANYKFVDSKESDFDVVQRKITLLGDYAAQFADLTYNGADRWLAVATKDVANLAPGETVGEDVSFDYSFTFKGSSQAEQKAIGAGEYVVTISLNEEASPNYAFDTDTVEFTIAKKALTITPDFDPATAETQNITVRYGNVLTSDYIREHYIRYDGFIDGESEQPESTDILSHIVVEQGYVYADAETRTDAGTKLPVTLRFEEDFAPDNYEVTFGQDTQIEVLKRQINIELTNEYEQNSYGYHVFGEYGKEIKPVIAQVSSGGIVEGDTESAEIAYTYYYYGASNDGTWIYSAQEAQEQGISNPPDKAGTYGVIVVLASGNYELAPEDTGVSEDRTTRTFENYYTILKQRVDSPKWAHSSLTATGGEQENTLEYNVSLYSYVTADSDNGNMPSVINSNGTITMRATYAGSYWVIFELNDPNNYVWRDLTGTEEGYDNPLIDIEWSISNYNDLTVTILGLDTNGDGSADLTPTAGEDGALWLNGSWAYGDAFGTLIAEGKYNDGQNTFEGTISIRFYLATSSEQVTNYRNAGTYYAVASVMASSDYNAAESERVYFTISRKALTVPAAESKEYSGAAVEALLADFNGATMNIVGIAQGLSYTLRDGAYYLSAVNAGTYYLNIALSDPNNYIWSGQSGSVQTTVEVRWTVTPKTVQAPELAEMSKTYTGDEFSYEVAQSEYYIVRGTTSATDAGDYTVTVALRSTTNFVWSTGGTANLSVTWHITKAENGWQEGQDTYSRDGWTYGSAAAEETVPVPEFGSVSVKYYTDASLQNEFTGAFDEQTNAGTYYVLIAVEGNDNYTGLTLGEGGTLSFTVEKASNNWIGSYAREGWTYGSDPSAETLPDADFGTVTVRYYTDSSHEHEYTQGFTRTTDAGVYYVTLTVEGNNNYDGLTEQAQFKIGKATAYVVWSGGSFTYDSNDQTAKITAQFYESVATAGGYLDLAVSIQSYNGEEAAEQFKDAGTYVFAASLAGTDYEKNYELSGQTHEYVMQRASVTVTLSAQEAVYSGQTPEIDQKAYEVTAGSAFGEDLGIELSVEGEFVNAGTYNIEAAYSNDTNFEVTFIGAQFVISPLEIRVEITPNGGSYGNVTAAQARVTNAGGEPVSGVQVTLTYTGTMNNGEQYTGTAAPAEAGSYIVTATVESTNYRLTSAEPASFIVSKARVSVGAIGSKAYNGKSQEADISVSGAEEDVYELINDGGKNAGNYEVLFTFKGDNAYNYVWFYNNTEVNGASLELTFSITVLLAAENPVSLDISGLDGWTYGDAAKTPSAEAKVYGEPVFYYAETENGTYTTAVPVHAGTYWVKAVVEATTNNEASSSEAKQFTIARAANGWLDGQDTYSRDGWTYGGDATAETFPVAKFGDMSVKYYTDAAHENEYTQSFGSATNAGVYYVVITVEGNTDYESLSLTGQFEVSKRGIAKPALADPADAAVETGELLHNEIAGYDGTLMQLSELEGGVSTVNGKTYLTATAAGVYRITIDLSDTSNYQWADGTDGALTLTWTLRRAELTGWTAESESRYPDVIVTAAGGIHPDYVVEIATIAAERYADYDLSAYENAEIVLGYDISMTSGGASVQPEGEITVRVRVPDGFADGGYTLLHLHNGEWTEVSYTVQDGYAEFATSSLSAFVFITQETPASLVWLIVVLAVLLTVEIVLMAVAVAKRRKGRNN